MLLIRTLILSAAVLLAWAAPSNAAMLVWDGVIATGGSPGVIAADGAGRVYVPDASTGLVAIYSSGSTGNSFLTSIGAGVLQQPYSVNVDNRETIYVADRATNKIALFDRYGIGLTHNGAIGGPGGAVGQLDGPAQFVSDVEPRLFVLETNNRRVQVLDPAPTNLTHLFTFGIADPMPFDNPTGIGLDSGGRIFVSSTVADGSIRAFDNRGAVLGPFATGLNAPAGLEVDPVDRLIVAESGAGRIVVFNSLAGGSQEVASLGTTGGGVNQFSSPASVALAPGAYLYVSDPGNQRVVRLRYDDQDNDGTIDARDVCRGLSNANQADADHDGLGDPCDDDDDNDKVADAVDICAGSSTGRDLNSDGCTDPTSQALYPRKNATFKKRGPALVSGIAYADSAGVARVEVAVGRRSGGACQWYVGRRWVKAPCAEPRFNAALGTRRWRLNLGRAAGRAGSYLIASRATQSRTSLSEAPKATTALHRFRVRSR